MRVITFSTVFPKGHPREGMPTFFVEKILTAIKHEIFLSVNPLYPPKYHTIRAGNRWKVGEYFSPRVWGNDINPKSGKSGPYQSKQIEFAPPIEIKKIWKIKITKSDVIKINGEPMGACCNGKNPTIQLCRNDGLEPSDFHYWFNELPFIGQIICWNENIEY